MTKKEVLNIVNNFYAYHISKRNDIKKFQVVNNVTLLDNSVRKACGVYFTFKKADYKWKGDYIYVCSLTIKNPYITKDQFFSSWISKEKKTALYENGYDSVVLVRNNEIVEVVCFTNAQIKIEKIITDKK